MSFFRKLFGGKTFDELRAEADTLFEAKQFADAMQVYDRAADAGEVPAEKIAAVKKRSEQCRDRIAEDRIALGDDYRKQGEKELAIGEYENAVELAVSKAIADRARKLIEDASNEEAPVPDAVAAGTAASDDERWAVISANWDETQMDEYDEYGESFRTAVLALEDGRGAEARPLLEQLLKDAEEPVFLLAMVGRARADGEDWDGAHEALTKFLAAIADEEDAREARLGANLSLARLADRKGDVEGAVNQYQAAIDSAEDDFRPYLELGAYLRQQGMPEDAVEVLEAGLPFVGEARPDLRIAQQLGLSLVELGQDEKAAEVLEGVVESLVARRDLNFPVESTIALAKLHEKHGRKDRAADLWARLSRGSDVDRHVEYHREAARLLIDLDLRDDARRMLQRARSIAEKKDPEAAKQIDEQLAQLG